MMFQAARAPKEGRLPHPGMMQYASGRGQKLQQRQGTIALVALLVFFAWFFLLRGDGTTAAVTDSADLPPGSSINRPHVPMRTSPKESTVPNMPSVPPADKVDSVPGRLKAPGGLQQPMKDGDLDTTEDSDGEPHYVTSAKDATSKEASKPKLSDNGPAPSSEKFKPRPTFERDLRRIIDLMPDDVYMRELIRPIESGGKERMRELGLRTRQYKKYFSAWEKLHLVEDEFGEVSVRDDVLQYLNSGLVGKGSGDELGLADVSMVSTIVTYEGFRTFLGKFAQILFPFTAPYFSDHMSLHAHFKKGGRGIVLTAGDDQAPYLMTGIYNLRKLGCNLPIEVHYLGDSDLGEDYRADLEALPGVVTRDVSRMIFDDGWRLAGWAAKPFAILVSSFREVIFIDADSLFFKNPETLFDDADYKETGALFFRDRLIMPESKKRFLQQILPKPIAKLAKQSRFWTGESGHMQESGVLVIDKWKHFIALLLVCRFNGSDRDTRDGKTGVYELMYGDKETFWIGWLLAGDEGFAFHRGDAASMGVAKPVLPEKQEGDDPDSPLPEPPADSESYEMCAPQLLHLDTEGKPLWFNGWIMDNKFAEKGKRNFATFETYLTEPRDMREPTAWQLKENNLCCLTSDKDKHSKFSAAEMEILNGIVEHAKKIGSSV